MRPITKMELGGFELAIYPDRPEVEFVEVKQVHGTNIVDVNSASTETEADGIISNSTTFSPMAIKTADCIPIVVIGDNGVAHLHAGWRGVADGIVEENRIKELNPTYIYLGPHIKSCCFEVSSDFIDNFNSAKEYLSTRNSKFYFDLQGYITYRINKLYPNCEVEHANDCTCCNSKYNSYRRDKTNIRNWNILFSQG